jgi:deazaflavin-dependent oxidoreductase (nitroreductase family)
MTGMEHPNGIQRLVRSFARSRFGAMIFSRLAPPLDRWSLRLSGGKTTATTLLAGYPVITLTTIGVKSGQPRSVSLLAVPDGNRLVLVASNFGNARHPAWYMNLHANPHVRVEAGGITQNYIVRTAQGEERQRLWDLAVAYYRGYNAYRQWADEREIPVVILTPIEI